MKVSSVNCHVTCVDDAWTGTFDNTIAHTNTAGTETTTGTETTVIEGSTTGGGETISVDGEGKDSEGEDIGAKPSLRGSATISAGETTTSDTAVETSYSDSTAVSRYAIAGLFLLW